MNNSGRNPYISVVVSGAVALLVLLQLALPGFARAQAASRSWEFNTPSDYTYDAQLVNVSTTVGVEWSVSTRVVSNNPVIAERSMYWNSGAGVYRQAAHDSVGY